MIRIALAEGLIDEALVDEHLRNGVPVVLTGGCPLSKGLSDRWSWSYLEGAWGDDDGLSVQFAPRGYGQFTRFYGEGLGKGGILLSQLAMAILA